MAGEDRSLTFDEVLAWLDEQTGRFVGVTVHGGPETRGNSGIALEGELRGRVDIVQVIDPRPGRIVSYAVAPEATFQLVEGDLKAATLVADDTLLLDLNEVQLNVVRDPS
jgi:hypothetical protein